MKILFVAKHGSGDNSDEEAVAFALQKLGHEVICDHEKPRHRERIDLDQEADLCLFFKWEGYNEIERISKRMPCFFWYFDLVSSEDPTLAARMAFRRDWFKRVLPHCKLGFVTDGDWVSQDTTGKLRWLMQGMDERVAGLGIPLPTPQPPILFTGTPKHGQQREDQIKMLKARYGDQFKVIGEGGPNGRIHGRQLADLFASVKVVIAPSGPVTDRYWSNRLYLTTGLGGLLLHPSSKGVRDQYSLSTLLCYPNDKALTDMIDQMLHPGCQWRDEWRNAGYRRTMAAHTYYHRCQQLIAEVERVI